MSHWIHSYASLRHHPKTRKLARRVGSIAQAIGHLHCLWWWSADYATDGDLTRFTAEDIADAAAWEDDPETFVGYLTECGFLDNGDGLRIHDHWEHLGRFIEVRESDAERKRQSRREPVQRTSAGRPADVPGTADVDREIDRKIDRTRARTRATAPTPSAHAKKAVDNSGNGGGFNITCSICGKEITDAVVKDGPVFRHKTCKPSRVKDAS